MRPQKAQLQNRTENGWCVKLLNHSLAALRHNGDSGMPFRNSMSQRPCGRHRWPAVADLKLSRRPPGYPDMERPAKSGLLLGLCASKRSCLSSRSGCRTRMN